MQVDHRCEFKTAEEAWKYAVTDGHRAAMMYNYDSNKLLQELRKLHKMIKEYNRNIKNIDEQLLSTYPYWYRETDECLGVQGVEIDISTVKSCRGCIALTGYNDSVLNIDEEIKYEER